MNACQSLFQLWFCLPIRTEPRGTILHHFYRLCHVTDGVLVQQNDPGLSLRASLWHLREPYVHFIWILLLLKSEPLFKWSILRYNSVSVNTKNSLFVISPCHPSALKLKAGPEELKVKTFQRDITTQRESTSYLMLIPLDHKQVPGVYCMGQTVNSLLPSAHITKASLTIMITLLPITFKIWFNLVLFAHVC